VYIPPRIAFVAILLLGVVSTWFALPTGFLNVGGIKDERDINLGLDLQGGLQVLLQADPPAGQTVDANVLSGTRDTVERRVNELGVSEPLISTRGDDQILVELPGITDTEQAIALLQRTALLEVIDPQGQYLPPGTVVNTSLGGPEDLLGEQQLGGEATPGATPAPDGMPDTVTASTPIATDGTPIAAGATPAAGTPVAETPVADDPAADGPVYTTIIQGREFTDAYPTADQLGGPVVAFELNDAGASALQNFTQQNIGRYMTIVVDKTVISSATIQAVIADSGQISGLTAQQANDLSIQLRAGSLQVPLIVQSSNTVGPSLGEESIDRSLIAGIVGLLTVALFMVFFYRLPGLLAVAALLIYTAVSFSLFKLFGVTMTLAGIAGFILSIGMAVDANVLIFARLRDELRIGHGLNRAVEQAFRNAFPSIRDSNTSTLITCAILWYFGDQTGTSLMTGFAITLAIGVVVSLLTAITVTRNFMRLTISSGWVRDPWLLGVERREAAAFDTAPRAAAGD
jgi:preprotein translocase subunit SecD